MDISFHVFDRSNTYNETAQENQKYFYASYEE